MVTLKLFAESYNSIFTAKTPSIKVVEEDPDDNKFIECAVALDSKIIISGDKHLKNIKKYIDIDIEIEIVSPKKFIESINNINNRVRSSFFYSPVDSVKNEDLTPDLFFTHRSEGAGGCQQPPGDPTLMKLVKLKEMRTILIKHNVEHDDA